MDRYKDLGKKCLVYKVHDGVPPEWFASNIEIDSHEFTALIKS